MVQEFRDVRGKGFRGPERLQRRPAWRKTIAFAATRCYVGTLAEIPDRHFADMRPHRSVRYADLVVGMSARARTRYERCRQAHQ